MVNIGDKIKYTDFEGVVIEKHAVSGDKLLIVKTYDNTMIKCYESEVEVVEDPEPADGRISEEDFAKAVEKILDPSTFEKMEKSSRTIVTVTGGMICELLRRELFDKG